MTEKFKYQKGDFLKHRRFGFQRMARVMIRGFDEDAGKPFYVANIIEEKRGPEFKEHVTELRYYDVDDFEEMFVPK